MDSIPMKVVDVWLKQIDRTLLSDLGLRAVRAAFPGFLESDEYWEHVRQLKESHPTLEQIPVPVIDGQRVVSGQERRFAGDHTLPRGCYYSLAHGEDGDDDGTLVAELYAYHDPDRAGPVLLTEIDLASLPAKDRLGNPLSPEHDVFDENATPPPCKRAIAVQFCPYDRQAHPFAREYLDEVAVFTVLLPVSVTRQQLLAVDLREPFIANYFAQWMSRLGKSPAEFPYFKYRPKVDRFIDILFTLLTQERGGGAFCKIAGIILRRLRYPALIYPSARADPAVEVRNGEVVSWRGWNLVDYRSAPPPFGLIHTVDTTNYWDPVVGERTGGLALGGGGEFVAVREVTWWASSGGETAGSWRINGIVQRLHRTLHETFARYGLELRAVSE